MSAPYCYWSVCAGPEAARMERCVRSARAAGVFKPFHVLADRPVEGAETYDTCGEPRGRGMCQLDYLKAGMSRLNFEHHVWVDPATVFTREPCGLLECLGRGPMHVPLEGPLGGAHAGRAWEGMDLARLGAELERQGVGAPACFSRSAFWIVHHEAIDQVHRLAVQFCLEAARHGFEAHAAAGLGYAMQLLCADPEAHRVARRPDLWASDDEGRFPDGRPEDQPWTWRGPPGGEGLEVRPAIVHLPRVRAATAEGTPREAGEGFAIPGAFVTKHSPRPA